MRRCRLLNIRNHLLAVVIASWGRRGSIAGIAALTTLALALAVTLSLALATLTTLALALTIALALSLAGGPGALTGVSGPRGVSVTLTLALAGGAGALAGVSGPRGVATLTALAFALAVALALTLALTLAVGRGAVSRWAVVALAAEEGREKITLLDVLGL